MVEVKPGLVAARLEPRVAAGSRRRCRCCSDATWSHISIRVSRSAIAPSSPWRLMSRCMSPAYLRCSSKHLHERGDAALLAEAAGVAEAEALKFLPGVIAHVAVGIEQAVEHVVVEHDEHAVLRGADVELVAVAAEFERGADRLRACSRGRIPTRRDGR